MIVSREFDEVAFLIYIVTSEASRIAEVLGLRIGLQRSTKVQAAHNFYSNSTYFKKRTFIEK